MVTGFFNSGAGGTRTHGPFQATAFRVQLVMTASIPLHVCQTVVFRAKISKFTCKTKSLCKETAVRTAKY